MTAAAIKASFADWKLIKTRAVVQIVFEVPLHEADSAYKVVGGMPDAAKERWFAIARLSEKAAADPVKESPASRSFNELPLPQQAGIRCSDPVFQRFLVEKHCAPEMGEDHAAKAVRLLCHVSSRSNITKGESSEFYWSNIEKDFQFWRIDP